MVRVNPWDVIEAEISRLKAAGWEVSRDGSTANYCKPGQTGGDRKRKNRTFRIRDSLDQRLKAAASASGRSVSEEIEYRLERSFWGGPT